MRKTVLDEYILRGYAISAICRNCPMTDYCRKTGELCEDVKRIIVIPAADVEPKRKWIPVSEDKPHSMANKVIVYCQGEDVPDYVGFGHFEKYHGEEIWYNLETGEPFETWGLTVTHWKETPEKPKKEKKLRMKSTVVEEDKTDEN